MQASLKRIQAQALSLSVEERASLATTLLKSLQRPSAEVRRRWTERIQQRLEAMERGDCAEGLEADEITNIRRLPA
jgi:hypothetical protein